MYEGDLYDMDIIDDITGRRLIFDHDNAAKHAPMIAAAPYMLRLLKRIVDHDKECMKGTITSNIRDIDEIRKLIKDFEHCDHKWVDASNIHIMGVDLCVKCHALRITPTATNHDH